MNFVSVLVKRSKFRGGNFRYSLLASNLSLGKLYGK